MQIDGNLAMADRIVNAGPHDYEPEFRYEIKLPNGCTYDARQDHYGETYYIKGYTFFSKSEFEKKKKELKQANIKITTKIVRL